MPKTHASGMQSTQRCWAESAGRDVVAARVEESGGRCEVCRAPGTEWSHRVDRSDGGTWSPVNGLWLDRRCHDLFHGHPEHAYTGGWRLRSTADPEQTPVWLWTPYGQGWFFLTPDGIYVFTTPLPTLPPWVVVLP